MAVILSSVAVAPGAVLFGLSTVQNATALRGLAGIVHTSRHVADSLGAQHLGNGGFVQNHAVGQIALDIGQKRFAAADSSTVCGAVAGGAAVIAVGRQAPRSGLAQIHGRVVRANRGRAVFGTSYSFGPFAGSDSR